MNGTESVGWQAIETAPRDGTWVLAGEFGNSDIVGDYYAASWLGNRRDGYWQARCGQYVTLTPEPTHWQPLPPPPSGDAA